MLHGNDRRRGVARRRLAWLSLALAAVVLPACSLAGDITPPPGSRLPTAAPATGTPAGEAGLVTPPAGVTSPNPTPATIAALPEAQPAALSGGYIYLERCAACHGPTGSGGGSMTPQLPAPPPDFADAATLRQRTPQELFAVITQGRLEAFMPPFAEVLSEAERWDAVAFLYTLSTPPERLEAGQAVYEANCQSCHGAEGQGNGPEAAALDQPLPDFTDAAYMAERSQQDLFDILSDDALHDVAGTLSEEQRWDALAYVRAFSYEYTAPDSVTAERQGTVTGQVTNATEGAEAPAGLTVNLHSFEEQALVTTLTTTVGADGTFTFEAVPYRPGREFVVTTEYNEVTYASEPGRFSADDSTLTLPVEVYETTADSSVLSVPQMHMFLEFASPDSVTVGQLLIFSNTGDRAFVPEGAQLLSVDLPEGATNLDVQGMQADDTYFRTEDGFNVLLTVPPGAEAAQLLFSFQLPYNQGLEYRQVMPYPVESVNVLVSDLGVELSGPQLQNQGTQNFQGQPFQNYVQRGVAAGEALVFEVSGRPGRAGATTPGARVDTTGLAIGLGALAAALLGIGFWMYRRSASGPAATGPAAADLEAMSDDELLQAMADLDEAYAAGEVDERQYQAERSALKDELRYRWEG